GVHVQVRVVPVIHRDTGEGEPLVVHRLHPAGQEDGVVGDPVGLHAALDQVDVQIHEPTHLDRTAEVDLTVALAEVQVADGEVRAVDIDRVEHPRTAGEVHDVHVSAVLTRWNGAGALVRHLLRSVGAGGSGQCA